MNINFLIENSDKSVLQFASQSFIAIKLNAKIHEIRAQLRNSTLWHKRIQKEQIVYVYVINDNEEFISVLCIDVLATADENCTLESILSTNGKNVRAVSVDESCTLFDALDAMSTHSIGAVPILSPARKIVAVFDYQCVEGKPNWSLLQERELEARLESVKNQVHAISGLDQEAMKKASLLRLFLLRSPWFIITCVVGGVCAFMLEWNHSASLKFPLVLCFLPLILAIADGVCHQANFISVSRLTGMKTSKFELLSLIKQEIAFGALLGFFTLSLITIVISVVFKSITQGLIIGLAAFFAAVAAGQIGLLVPVCINQFKGNADASSGPTSLGVTDLTAVVIVIILVCAF